MIRLPLYSLSIYKYWECTHFSKCVNVKKKYTLTENVKRKL